MSLSEPPAITEPGGEDALAATAGETPLRELWQRFRRQRLAMAAVVFIGLVVLIALAAPLLAPYDPNTPFNSLNAGPSGRHWLGTDDNGHDILSRLLWGARVSMRAAFQVVGMALVIALPLGLVAGYARGKIEGLIMRCMDALFTFPPLLLALSVTAVLSAGTPNLGNALVAISIVFVPGFVRLVRGEVLAVREETYVEAARAIGVRPRRIVLRHVLPNIASPLVVQLALSCGYAILAEAGLSFLGLGAGQDTPSWGVMVRRAYDAILDSSWPLYPPGIAILLTVLAFNMVGDGLRDALGRHAAPMVR